MRKAEDENISGKPEKELSDLDRNRKCEWNREDIKWDIISQLTDRQEPEKAL